MIATSLCSAHTKFQAPAFAEAASRRQAKLPAYRQAGKHQLNPNNQFLITQKPVKHFLLFSLSPRLLISPSPNPLIPYFGRGVEILNEGILELP